MRVGVVVHDQVDGLDVALGGHRQVALDDHRHDAAVLGHERHVQREVAPPDGPVRRTISCRIRATSSLGTSGSPGRPGPGGQQALAAEQRAGADQSGGEAGASEERAAGRLVRCGTDMNRKVLRRRDQVKQNGTRVISKGDMGPRGTPAGDDFPRPAPRGPAGPAPQAELTQPFRSKRSREAHFRRGDCGGIRPVSARLRAGLQLVSPRAGSLL